MSLLGTSDDARSRALRTLTWFTVVWVVLCIAGGIGAGWQIAQLRSSADALNDAGEALSKTGDALSGLSKLPLVGGDAKRAADAVGGGGDRAQQAAGDARDAIRRTAIMTGLFLALLPTIPLLVLRRSMVALHAESRP